MGDQRKCGRALIDSCVRDALPTLLSVRVCVRCVHCRLQFVKRSLADFVSVLFRRADGRDGAVSRAQFDSLGMLVRGGPSVVAQVRAVRVLARVWARVCDYCWCGYWCGCRKRARSCWE